MGEGRGAKSLHLLRIYFLSGFPGGSAGKESACKEGDLGSVPGLGSSPGEGKGCPRQYSGLENSMDCIVHGVAKSWTRVSDFHFHTSYHTLGNRHASGQLSPGTRTTESVLWNSRAITTEALMPQGPGPAAREAQAPELESSPHSLN